MPKRIVKLRTPAGKCAICGAGDEVRDRVDAVLARHGEIDTATGAKLTWPYLVDVVVPHVLGRKVSMTSVRRHLGTYGKLSAHTQLVDTEADAEKLEEAAATVDTGELLEEIDKLLDGDTISATAVLGFQLRAWALSIRKKVALGEEVTMTADAAQRAAAILLKSEAQASEQNLIAMLASGIGRGFEDAVAAGRRGELAPRRGLPPIVDAEVVEEEDVGVVAPAPSPAPPPPPPPPIPAPPPVVVVDDEPMTMRERWLRDQERPGGYGEKVDGV